MSNLNFVTTTNLPVGVTFDNQRGLYRVRRDSLHYGYFDKLSDALKANKVVGISVDTKSSKYRVRINGKSYGFFKTRTAAVKTAIKVVK